jgi:hypothetical protein
MTTPTDLIDQCRQQGIVLYLDGEALRYRCPRGALSPELKSALAAGREGLRAHLQGPPPVASSERDRPTYLPCCCPSGICWRCCNRPCEVCGKPTGSAFIRRCVVCGQLPDVA